MENEGGSSDPSIVDKVMEAAECFPVHLADLLHSGTTESSRTTSAIAIGQMELPNPSVTSPVRYVKLGGIAFNRIQVGRRRTVIFTVANTGTEGTTMTVEKMRVIQVDPNLLTSSPATLDSTLTFHNRIHSPISHMVTESEPIQKTECPFYLSLTPKLPIHLKHQHEVECHVVFEPSQAGFYAAVIEISTRFPHPRQRITLHGEAEIQTHPQQIFYDNRMTSEATYRSPSQSYLLSQHQYKGIDEDSRGQRREQEENSMTTPVTGPVPYSAHSTKSPLASLQQSQTITERFNQIDESIADILRALQLTKRNSPKIASPQGLNDTQRIDMKSLTADLSDLSSLSSLDDHRYSDREEESIQTSTMSEEDRLLFEEMRTPDKKRDASDHWKSFLDGSSRSSTPPVDKMSDLYLRTGKHSPSSKTPAKQPTTPQIASLFKPPDYSEPFWTEKMQVENTPVSNKSRRVTQRWNSDAVTELNYKWDEKLVLDKEIPVLPVVFCHGLLGFDQLGPLHYWRGIKKDLESKGIKTIIMRVPPTDSIEGRALFLRDSLNKAMEQMQAENKGDLAVAETHRREQGGTVTQSERLGSGSQPNPSRGHKEKESPPTKRTDERSRQTVNKVHIIGHSMAGLDCRYLISQLGGHEYVFSLTTLGTPHRGSSAADYTLRRWGEQFRVLNLLKLLGIKTGAWKNLTRRYLVREFNTRVKNHPDVQYYSVSGGGDKAVSKFSLMRIFYKLMLEHEGPNDGLVSVQSAKWGQHLGIVEMDHLEMVNWSLSKDTLYLYRNIARLLAEKEKEAGIQ
ncbi:hypothetical protein PROFUN_08592 [Planoprotostelium fungivorum]|uniref:GPI inositol-deacylase n=1 Tax=Planoprotostelium fungivorum TaxID=1890364 RepID=A0A2P6NJ60_9EUKA|nr:hypothetical protein PROFUN_08592 [Planoprotostelium fungivorum]